MSRFTIGEIISLRYDPQVALRDMEDTSTYRDCDDLLERARSQCFNIGRDRLLPKEPPKINDLNGLPKEPPKINDLNG
jgi:hypothetical protein